jgi:hypothetical protein
LLGFLLFVTNTIIWPQRSLENQCPQKQRKKRTPQPSLLMGVVIF